MTRTITDKIIGIALLSGWKTCTITTRSPEGVKSYTVACYKGEYDNPDERFTINNDSTVAEVFNLLENV